MKEQLQLNQRILQHLSPLAAKGDFEALLSDATLYMEFLSNLVVAWQWLKMGRVAVNGKSDFHAAKLHTMRFFFQYELGRNHSVAEIMLKPDRLTLVTAGEVLD